MNRRSAFPRHTEINRFLARKICRDLGIAEPGEMRTVMQAGFIDNLVNELNQLRIPVSVHSPLRIPHSALP
jgi:hypothetical protein